MAGRELPAELIGVSPAIEGVRATIRTLTQAGEMRPNVLLEGEAGAGKSLVATLLHRLGRPEAPMVAVDCAATPESLLRKILFGPTPGESRGRPWLNPGLLQVVAGGTIILEEVCHLPGVLQAMLVRMLQQQTTGMVQTWVIGTCNIDVDTALRAGYIQEELFQRLATVRIGMPPLRDCGNDVLIIATQLLPWLCAQHHRPLITLGPEVEKRLLTYYWPGNMRELTAILERAVLLATGSVISVADLDLPPARESGSPPAFAPPAVS